MNQQSDSQLLRAYAEKRAEAAFAELVRRHVDFTYSAALRMVRDPHLAEDVTQGVFVALAKSAAQLTERPVLSGWLHRTAQNIAAQTVRTIERRRTREQEAVAMNELLSAQSETSWQAIAPHLDAALGELDESDRDALLLRYFEKKSAAEMADVLGISAEAAQKRVSRAVERLREFFSKRNVTIGASGLVLLISANAVQAAPVGLITAISAAALAGSAAVTSAAVTTSTVITATKAIAMTTLQKTVITATVAVLAGAGIYEARQAAQFRGQNRMLLLQQAPLAKQIQQLQKERDETAERLAAVAGELEQRKAGSQELLGLRAEVARLRGDLQELAQLKASETNDPALIEMKSWLARVNKLKQGVEAGPSLRIPEFQLLTEDDWLKAAKLFGLRPQFDAETDFRVAVAELRQSAQNAFANLAQQALNEFAKANGGNFPDDLGQLKPYFIPPIDDAILARYMTAPAEGFGMKVKGQDWVITQRELVDTDYDHAIGIGPESWGYKQSVAEQLSPDLLAAKTILDPVAREFSAANAGQQPSDPAQLQPYVRTAEQQAALQKFIQLRNLPATNK